MSVDFTTVLPAILAHAQATPNRESCGLVTVHYGLLRYHPCRNVARSDTEFEIHPEDYVALESEGIVGVVHSHLHGSPEPSMADLVGCEQSGLPWFILALPNGAHKTITPAGYKAPLLGRPFVHGVFDCYSLARDWYAEQGISVLDFDREQEWWLKGANMLTPENFAKAGFVVVTDGSLKPGDGLIMQNGSTTVPNHVAVYLGDMVLLHHCSNRLSCRQPYGGYWAKVTCFVVRHSSKC